VHVRRALTCKDLLCLKALAVCPHGKGLQLGNTAVLHPDTGSTHCTAQHTARHSTTQHSSSHTSSITVKIAPVVNTAQNACGAQGVPVACAMAGPECPVRVCKQIQSQNLAQERSERPKKQADPHREPEEKPGTSYTKQADVSDRLPGLTRRALQ
jgi:hypothetical protein